MQKLFNRILVPVDFSPKSAAAVEKAVNLADSYHCSVYLLHVVSTFQITERVISGSHLVLPRLLSDNKSQVEVEMEKYRKYVNAICGQEIQMKSAIRYGSWNEAVIDFVIEKNIDLVLIGQVGRIFRKRKMLLNPDQIAEITNIPVITAPANRRLTKLFSIVIPITNFLPVRKLIYGIYMASQYNSTLKLLGIENSKTRDIVQYYVSKARELIVDNCDIKTDIEIVVSNNTAEAVNEYAMMNSSDLVIVNPGSETRMPGYFSYLLGNIMQKYATPPVLTISPAQA